MLSIDVFFVAPIVYQMFHLTLRWTYFEYFIVLIYVNLGFNYFLCLGDASYQVIWDEFIFIYCFLYLCVPGVFSWVGVVIV